MAGQPNFIKRVRIVLVIPASPGFSNFKYTKNMGRIKDNWVYILEYREKFGMPKDADELDAFVVWIEKQKLKDIKRFL